MAREIRLKPCACGGEPGIFTARVAEDAEECWAECGGCGAKTEPTEDAYADYDTAEYLWNSGVRA